LIVDELGYLSLDQQTSNLFYQVISTRHSQKRSTIITTNTPFSDWGNILFNTTIVSFRLECIEYGRIERSCRCYVAASFAYWLSSGIPGSKDTRMLSPVIVPSRPWQGSKVS